MSQSTTMPSPPPVLDPPFRGYIETTFDSLLVFEAARRGMIPRVTRRLIDRERGMVQSGAVFVFDEHESGIKRWTDGLVWSPSRILGNFLVYRETDKRQGTAPAPMSSAQPIQPSTSPSPNSGSSPSTTPAYPPYDAASGSGQALGQGQLNRPRSTSEGGTLFDRQKERQLVGSLTSSYKFKEGGLVKKTMSVTVNGFSQHMISYYSVEDVLAGKLRSPSTIPELASLEISPEYLSKQNFRFPPQIEVGHDGIPRYRGEPEEPASPTGQSHSALPNTMMSYAQPQDMPMYNSYGNPMQSSPAMRSRSVTGPILIPAAPSHGSNYMSPGAHTNGAYLDHGQMPMAQPGPPPIIRQNSASSIQSQSSSSGAIRPTSSHRRYDPYGDSHGPGSPRPSSFQHQPQHLRRQSMQPGSQSSSEMYVPSPYSAPGTLPGSYHSYHYQPPATAPSAYSEYYSPMPPRSAQSQAHGMPSPLSPNPGMLPYPQSQPYNWPRGTPVSDAVLPGPPGVDFAGPPSSSGSSGAGSGGSGIMPLSASAQRPMSGPHPAAVLSPISNGHNPSQLPPSWAPPPSSSLWNGTVDTSGIPVRNQMETFGSPQQAQWPRPGQETRIS